MDDHVDADDHVALTHESFVMPTPQRHPPPPRGSATTPPPAAPPPFGAEDASSPMMYLWATGIAVETFKAEFQRFLETYQTQSEGIPATEAPRQPVFAVVPYYVSVMQRMHSHGHRTLNVDFYVLRRTYPRLYSHTVAHPSECLQLMGAVAESMYRRMFPSDPEFAVAIAAHDLPFSIALRSLEPQHIETLVAVKGMVVRTSRLLPEVRVAHFRCWSCSKSEDVLVQKGRIFEPTRCSHCGKQCSYSLVHNLSLYEDKQIIRVQEAPEHLAEGETPVTLSVVVYGDLVDSVVPGDRVTVTGIYRSAPLKLNPNTRIIRSVFRTHVDAVHIAKTARGASKVFGASSNEEEHGTTFSESEQDAMHRLAHLPDIEQILVRSLAPGIWGHDEVKRGVLCQLFGGCRKEFRHGKFRAELNVLLCGDPGVAKSQLLTRVHQLTPRGIYTSGKGSSSVGLTAFVVRDADTQEFVLEPGALVLSDRGLCCIDEFDKMNEATRSVLHEVMEQQTLSIAKAGIIAQLNARTSILAAANPKESQWNQTLSIVENLQIEPTLLSRFDLIFLLLDRDDEQQDRMLATHVLSMYMTKEQQAEGKAGMDQAEGALRATRENLLLGNHEWFDPELPPRSISPRYLSRYIAFVREKGKPLITHLAGKALSTAYLSLRAGNNSGKTVSATLRQLESLIRLSEARAKMRLALEVTEEDVQESKSLIETALRMSAWDPRTGTINMDLFASSDPTMRFNAEGCMRALEEVIRTHYITAGKRNAPLAELRRVLIESMGGKPLAPHQFVDVLTLMSGGDTVQSFTSSTVTFVSA